MKKVITISILLISAFSFSQKITENKVDEFTKSKIIRTDWEKICNTTKLYLNVRISKVDNLTYLDLKLVTNSVTSIDIDDNISFMFEDGSILNLNSTQYQLTNYGKGAVGIVGSEALGLSINCILTDIQIEKFKTLLVNKIRINKSEGYSEDGLKSKNSEKFRKMFLLI